MECLKVTAFFVLAISCHAAPSPQAQSYSSYTSGLAGSKAPLTLSEVPLAFSHSPALVSHSPALVSHTPVLVSHAPALVSHAPVELQPATEIEHYAPPNYEFKYGVRDEHTHDIKEQAEKRIGDKVTGYYSLLEPDGNTRTVHYSSDKHTGFQAQVTRSGHSSHPAAPVISYQPAVQHLALPHAQTATSYGALSSNLALLS